MLSCKKILLFWFYNLIKSNPYFMMFQILLVMSFDFGIFNPKSLKIDLIAFFQYFNSFFISLFFSLHFVSFFFRFIFNRSC